MGWVAVQGDLGPEGVQNQGADGEGDGVTLGGRGGAGDGVLDEVFGGLVLTCEVVQGGAGQGSGRSCGVGFGEFADAGLVQGLLKMVVGVAQVDGVSGLALAVQH